MVVQHVYHLPKLTIIPIQVGIKASNDKGTPLATTHRTTKPSTQPPPIRILTVNPIHLVVWSSLQRWRHVVQRYPLRLGFVGYPFVHQAAIRGFGRLWKRNPFRFRKVTLFRQNEPLRCRATRRIAETRRNCSHAAPVLLSVDEELAEFCEGFTRHLRKRCFDVNKEIVSNKNTNTFIDFSYSSINPRFNHFTFAVGLLSAPLRHSRFRCTILGFTF